MAQTETPAEEVWTAALDQRLRDALRTYVPSRLYHDALQEGRRAALRVDGGHTEAFYLHKAIQAAQDYARRLRVGGAQRGVGARRR